jgi:hypothetical protein
VGGRVSFAFGSRWFGCELRWASGWLVRDVEWAVVVKRAQPERGSESALGVWDSVCYSLPASLVWPHPLAT